MKGKKDFYSLVEIARDAGVTTAQVKKYLKEIGIYTNTSTGSKRTRGRKIHHRMFSPEERQVVINSLKDKK